MIITSSCIFKEKNDILYYIFFNIKIVAILIININFIWFNILDQSISAINPKGKMILLMYGRLIIHI